MKHAELTENLNSGKLSPITLHHPGTTGSLVILPRGARVLGAYSHADAQNAFWTGPLLDSPAGVQKLLATNDELVGGDRLWLAPELGLFFRHNKDVDAKDAFRPTSIDPGHYTVASADVHHVKFTARIETPYHLAKGQAVIADVERTIRIKPSPFHDAPDALPELRHVKYVGYSIATRLELLAAPLDGLFIGAWFLIQLPAKGYAYIPTYSRATVTDYYEPTGPAHLKHTAHYVRFRIDSAQRHKIGVRKTEVEGRIAYLSDSQNTGESTLVVRNFLNNPSATYADVPLHTPAGTQDSVQCYNHYKPEKGFGEIEFHAPGVCRAMAEPVILDVNQVWIFTGTRKDLTGIAARLLGLPAADFAEG